MGYLRMKCQVGRDFEADERVGKEQTGTKNEGRGAAKAAADAPRMVGVAQSNSLSKSVRSSPKRSRSASVSVAPARAASWPVA